MAARPTWAIVTPVDTSSLRKLLAEDETHEDLQVIEGTRDHNAIVDYEPGSEYSGERELAARLAAENPGKHYIVYLYPEDDQSVAEFEDGALVAEDQKNGEALARKLGVPLVEAPAPIPVDEATIVLGATPRQTAEALGVKMPGPESTLHLEQVPLGTLAYSTAGSLVLEVRELSSRLHKPVYFCTRDRDPRSESFRCRVVEEGKDRSRFEVPPTAWSEGMRTDSILGEATPEGIQRKLGIRW